MSQDNNLDPLSLSQMPRRRPACIILYITHRFRMLTKKVSYTPAKPLKNAFKTTQPLMIDNNGNTISQLLSSVGAVIGLL